MSFLNAYLNKNNLPLLTESAQKTLNVLEKNLSTNVDNNPTPSKFEDLIKDSGDKIASIVERFGNYWKSVDGWSLSSLTSSFRFVLNIGVEVSQILNQVQKHLVTDDMTPEQAKQSKTQFGQELTFFIWKTVDPLKSKFNWLPFKSSIEKKLVFWLSGMALEFAQDLINPNVQQMAVTVDTKEGLHLKTM